MDAVNKKVTSFFKALQEPTEAPRRITPASPARKSVDSGEGGGARSREEELEEELEAMRKHQQRLTSKVSAADVELDRLRGQLSGMSEVQKERDRLQASLKEMSDKYEGMKAMRDKLAQGSEEAEKAITSLEDTKAMMAQQVASLKGALEEQERRYAEKSRECRELEGAANSERVLASDERARRESELASVKEELEYFRGAYEKVQCLL